ncbi:deoxyribodipyrimidine photo-lyase [Orbus mooreae]|uniref:deoxyribodipyrimidine photo-lyase n=1 Tax=Orbus mooreae TaxID=3074107 RepID=UPI00370DA5B6
MATHLVWFRNDLRVIDNAALYHACQDPDAQVIAVYIATPTQWQQHAMSARQGWFIYQHLMQLQKSLKKINIPLIYHETATFSGSIELIRSICRQYKITDLFYNKQYQWNERQRDHAINAQLIDDNIHSHPFDDSVLFAPNQIINGSGKMYQVFTPFRNKCCEILQTRPIHVYPKPKVREQVAAIESNPIKPFSYVMQEADYAIGEESALAQLRTFCQESAQDYLQQRDFPILNSTSHLSAYLAVGVLSPRQCLARLTAENPNFMQATKSGAFGWFSQLIWREFYIHLLFIYPKLSKNSPFITWTERVQWRKNDHDLHAWQQGLTGFPIVDAAMRQLNQTGWMHNRLRMIVASFLVKDLLIDWHDGERYFMSQLIDGDLALNNGGWQWAASTGTDAAPYFRIFNPTTQSQRFDHDGQFIRQYLPELSNVPNEAIHEPHKWAKTQGIKLNYPEPIVEHAKARQYTLAAFNAAK